MATVTELDSDLEYAISDPNENTWNQTQRLDKLNEAQIDLINFILSKAILDHRIYDILAEIQETQSGVSLASTGYDFGNVTTRDYMTNGLVQVECTLASTTRYPVPTSIASIGVTQNRFMGGDNSNPLRYIWNNKLFVLADSYPITTNIYYIGRPYTLGTSSSGSGKTQVVDTPDINVSMHQLLVKMAKVKLLSMRSEEKDLAEIQLTNNEITININSIIEGAIGNPDDEAPKGGNWLREQIKPGGQGAA